MHLRLRTLLLPVLLVGWATPALADPCEGKLPAPGTQFSGVVRYVGDGDSLCVGPARQPDRWIEIRLADFYAPELNEPGGREARRALEKLTRGRTLICRAGKRSYDRVVARCTLGGVALGDRLRAAGIAEGGRGRR